jgi:TPR repeat protein
MAALAADFKTGLDAYNRGDFATALREWQPIAEKGDPHAQYNLGLLFARGQGVTQDYAQAATWYQKAADQGVPAAQYNLGVMYANGQGVKADPQEASRWFLKAAEQGVSDAANGLGRIYYEGEGAFKNYGEAEKWYRKAADQGVASAAFNLGVMYDLGHGVAKDYNEATKWYQKAAEAGYAPAMANLGILYYNAQGVKRDLVQAYAWFARAQKFGDPRAGELLSAAENKLQKKDLKKAQATVEQWQPSKAPPTQLADAHLFKAAPAGDGTTASRQEVATATPAQRPANPSRDREGVVVGATAASRQEVATATPVQPLPNGRGSDKNGAAAQSASGAETTAQSGGGVERATPTSAADRASAPQIVKPTPVAQHDPQTLPTTPTQNPQETAPATPKEPSVKPAAQQDVWNDVGRVVAVGDVHGDYEQFTAVLASAGLIDGDGNWTGGKTHLVQTGDVVDRGPDSRAVMDLLMKLEKQAAAAGGAVHALIGNHEAMNVYGDLRYVSPGEFASYVHGGEASREIGYGQSTIREPARPEIVRVAMTTNTPAGYVEHRAAFAPDGVYGRWIRSHNSIIRINRTLFLHAGLGAKYEDWPLDRINDEVRAELNDFTKLHGGAATDEDGPLWFRGLAKDDEQTLTPLVDQLLKHFDVDRIVIGHTYAQAAITPRFGGKVVMIDIGLSRVYDNIGKVGCLEIDGDHALAIHRGQKLELPKDEGADLLRYLREAAALDPKPSPLEARIGELQK